MGSSELNPVLNINSFAELFIALFYALISILAVL